MTKTFPKLIVEGKPQKPTEHQIYIKIIKNLYLAIPYSSLQKIKDKEKTIKEGSGGEASPTEKQE